METSRERLRLRFPCIQSEEAGDFDSYIGNGFRKKGIRVLNRFPILSQLKVGATLAPHKKKDVTGTSGVRRIQAYGGIPVAVVGEQGSHSG